MPGKSAGRSQRVRPTDRSVGRGRREERRLQTQDLNRTHLLDAAEEVFGSKGFHAATIKEVADCAESSIGLLYSLFENKDDLFRQIFVRRGDEFMPGMRSVMDEPSTPRERLHALVDFQVQFFRDHPHFGRLYARSSTPTLSTPEEQSDPIVVERYEQTLHMQADLFAQGQASGDFIEGDPGALARLLAGMVTTYVALDPAVTTADAAAPELLALATFHDLVDRAFAS